MGRYYTTSINKRLFKEALSHYLEWCEERRKLCKYKIEGICIACDKRVESIWRECPDGDED